MKRIAEADLKLLQIFATIVDCKGFAAAQAELNLSAPSISGYVTALEQRLGVRLCSRGRAGFAVTDKGTLIYREAQRLFAAADAFTAAAGAVRGRLTGTLRLGTVDCTVTDPNSPLGRAISRFNARDNEVQIELTIQAPQDLQRNVLDGRLHLAIGGFPARISALLSQPLYRERNAFYCAAGHALFAKERVTLDDVRAHRVVARGYWRRADLGRLGIEREAATVDNIEAQATLILSGAYLGYLPEHYATSLQAGTRLRALLPETLAYDARFTMISARSRAQVLVVRQFADDLLHCAGLGRGRSGGVTTRRPSRAVSPGRAAAAPPRRA